MEIPEPAKVEEIIYKKGIIPRQQMEIGTHKQKIDGGK